MNIRRLASTLQLSPGTVSRSLRHHPDIPNATRERVIRAAAEMGYTPRAWTPRRKPAATPASHDVRSLGVLVGDGYGLRPGGAETSFIAHHFLAAILPAAQRANATTSTAFIEPAELPKLESPANYPPLLRSGRLDGLILIYPFPPEVVAALSRKWPCVSIERHDTRGLIDAVGHAQTPAFAESVSRLHERAHRRIGFVADIHAPGPRRLATNERFAGYLSGLDRLGLPYDPANVVGMFGKTSSDEQLARDVAARAKAGVTGWVCALDRQAYLLMRDLPKLGLRVPKDVSIIGYTGIDPLFVQKQVTTWRIPYERIGSAAVEAVLNRAENPQSPAKLTEFCCEYIAGETLGPG